MTELEMYAVHNKAVFFRLNFHLGYKKFTA